MKEIGQPLGRRLRYAALDRVHTGSERIDDFVLDDDGVIDLRVFDREHGGMSIAAPAAALASIRGLLGDAAEISELYDESEPDPPRWRLGFRAHPADDDEAPAAAARPAFPQPVAGPTLPPISRLSMVPLSESLSEPQPAPPTTESNPELDPRDEERPTAECPLCASIGHLDLFDRFSQVEFYSCDSCSHMWQQDRG